LITTDFVPPGEVLLEEFLRPMGLSQYRLAIAIGMPWLRPPYGQAFERLMALLRRIS
jgi:hypothetical protein